MSVMLKYPGSKYTLAPWIVSHFAPHTHFLDSHSGSGVVLLSKQAAPHEVLNDLDGRLVNAFRVVREHGDKLAGLIEMTPYSRAEYYLSYEQAGDPVEDARRFFVRCWMAHGFKPYCRTGWRHNGSKSIQPVTTLWAKVPDTIRAVMLRLKSVEIECMPALALIERYRTPDTLIYCDPPYVMSTRAHKKIYAHEMSDQEHLTLLDALDAHPGMVALSGYRSRLYDERLPHWRRVERSVQDQKGKPRTECLWLNPALDRRNETPLERLLRDAA
jgi:DNA adenine methylase